MKLEPNRHLFLATCFMALLVGCSDSSQPLSSDDKDDAEQAAPAVAQAGTSPAASPDTPALGEGPAITGADAPHPDDKPAIIADGELPPLPIEETGRVATLPMSYPESWVMVDEASFFNMFGGKVIVLDVAETKHSKRIKGLVHKNLLGNFNRMQALPERYAMALSSDEKLLYAANFDPAASFNVVDLDSQKVVAEIGTPGCVLTYPLGKRSVASLCSNGAIMTSNLKDDGTLDKQSRSEPFFDTNDTPIFEHAVFVDGIAHFPSFKGLLHSFDMTGEDAKYLGSWDMLSEQDKKGKWRPSGLGLNDFDDAGLMYTIFQPDGHEGTQTHGGTQVWVFDLKTKQRVRVIETPNWAISIAVTRGAKPLLVVTNGELNLDVFNAQDGSLIQTVSDFGNVTPLLVHKSY
jgi:methylamine dehydrogenase heavy chain